MITKEWRHCSAYVRFAADAPEGAGPLDSIAMAQALRRGLPFPVEIAQVTLRPTGREIPAGRIAKGWPGQPPKPSRWRQVALAIGAHAFTGGAAIAAWELVGAGLAG